MNDTKRWYQSIGIWAAVTTLAAAVLRLFRIEVDPALQRDAAEWLLSAATLAGGAGALWGRLRASRRIAPSPAGPNGGQQMDNTAPGGRGTRLSVILLPMLLGSAVTLSGGCAALSVVSGPGGAYVAADRATYDAVAPALSAYVAADPALAPDDRARRERTLQTWRLRLEAAEQSAAARPGGTVTAPD